MAGNRTRYEEALSHGHSYSWDQRWQEAIRSFRIAIQEMPALPAPYAGLAMAHFELNQLDNALRNYKEAARLSRGDLIYLRQVADVQERLGQLAEAGQTYMAIGEIHLRKQQLDEAIDNWQRAVRVAPSLLGAHQRLAAVYRRRGMIRNAIREYLAIARIWQERGDNTKALATCQQGLELDPRNADVLTAIELIKRGEQAFADEDAADASAEGDSMSYAVQRIATALEANGSARKAPKRAQDHNPVQESRRLAQSQLAQEIFEDEDDQGGLAALSKLERDALISQALDFQTRNQPDQAITCLERALQGGVTSAAAHFSLGLLYQDRLRFEDGIREFRTAVQDSDYTMASHFALGECFRAIGQMPEALDNYVAVLELIDLTTVGDDQAPQVRSLYANLAESILSKGEKDQATGFANALTNFLSAPDWPGRAKQARQRLNALSGGRLMTLADMLTAGSQHVLESLYLSQEYIRRGLYNSAIEETYRAIQLSPSYLPAHIQLAELLHRQGLAEVAAAKFIAIGDIYLARNDVAGAMGAYSRVVELAPLDMTIRARLIDMLRRNGRIDEALEQYQATGEAFYQLAETDQAREMYEEGLRLSPRSKDERRWKAIFLRRLGDIDAQKFQWHKALATFNQLRRVAPEDERAAIRLIDLYFRVDKSAEALQELDRFLVQLVKSGQMARVTTVLEELVQQRPHSPGLVRRLARLYLQQGRREDAIRLLDRLGEVQLEAGHRRQAVATIEQIIKLNPANVQSYQQLIAQLKA